MLNSKIEPGYKLRQMKTEARTTGLRMKDCSKDQSLLHLWVRGQFQQLGLGLHVIDMHFQIQKNQQSEKNEIL